VLQLPTSSLSRPVGSLSILPSLFLLIPKRKRLKRNLYLEENERKEESMKKEFE